MRLSLLRVLVVVAAGAWVLVPTVADAHGGGTDSNGGHYCRDAGYSSGKCAPLNSYHCHEAGCVDRDDTTSDPTPSPSASPDSSPIKSPASSGSLAALERLRVAAESDAGYDRDLFEHWIDADGDGCDTRVEVLQQETQTSITGGDCSLTGGSWFSEYDGETWTDPSDVDIDHFVPLKEAWGSGASGWDSGRRRDLANDLGYEGSLIAVTDNVNSSKGDSDPAEWLPPRTAYHCTYATTWVEVKERWDLAVDTAEKDSLRSLITSCVGSATSDTGSSLNASPPLDTASTGTPSRSQIVRGGTLVIKGDGFQPNSTATATFKSDPVTLGSIAMDETGRFSVSATVPTDAALGDHQIVVEGPNPGGGIHRLTFAVTVAASLPATGSYAGLLVLLAAVFVVIGVDLVLLSKRHLLFQRLSARRSVSMARRL